MAIVQKTIKTQVNALIEQTKGMEQKESQEAFADGLATIIEQALKSAQVLIQAGAILTAGGPTSQTNAAPVTGTLQ